MVLSRLWNELKLPYKLTYLKNGTNVQFDFSEVVRQLCLTRILSPWSKAKTKRLVPVTYLGARAAEPFRLLQLLRSAQR